ncbi:MAG: alanine racemase [Alphaproteobacteria bacterium]|nr:alanine racemase [Alphaproteobacteria bacterium]
MAKADPASLLTVDLGAIVANWRDLAARVAPARCAAVVKADGYGLGSVAVAHALAKAGCRDFFVARLNEGLAVRDAVPEDCRVTVLDGLMKGEAELYRRRNLTPSLNDPGQIAEWSAQAKAAGEKLAATLHFDTGMSRLGLTPREGDALLADRTKLDGIALSYVMSHLVASEERDNPINATQLAAFKKWRAAFPDVAASFANSSGIFLGPEYHFDVARPGCALYGINPTPDRPNPMRGTAKLEARILQVREIDSPQTVGYGAMWKATRPTRVATIACGYADGWLRTFQGKGQAWIDGRSLPFIGRVSMDLITIDVSDMASATQGRMVELLGPNLPVDAVAEAAGTIGYEILTRLGARFARTYIEP